MVCGDLGMPFPVAVVDVFGDGCPYLFKNCTCFLESLGAGFGEFEKGKKCWGGD